MDDKNLKSCLEEAMAAIKTALASMGGENDMEEEMEEEDSMGEESPMEEVSPKKKILLINLKKKLGK
jgi:hypothetical protein